MKHAQQKRRFWNDSRLGFTLVEMLVSVSLVLIIMLLLANVFGLAANTVEKQKGTAENDQQARSFTTILKGDLCSRSFRFVYPFPIRINMNDVGADYDETLRRGYFSISENDPNNSQDDVLSFTIDYSLDPNIASCVDSDDQTKFYGRATLLKDPASGLSDNAYLRANPNQPEFDDGYPVTNDLGRSPYAEVVYFLRNGNLYRRVLLIRKPLNDDGDTSPQLSEITGNYPGTYAPLGSDGTGPVMATGEFNRDFDFSASYDFGSNEPFFPTWNGSGGFAFSNDSRDAGYFDIVIQSQPGSQANYNNAPDSLGIPHFRYGHDPEDPRGRAREFTQGYTFPNANGEFFGRYTLQETCHSDFDFPGSQNGSNNPYRVADYGSLTIDSSTGAITAFGDETERRGDDIMLTGVLSFDVKVWDDSRREFVDLGNSGGGQYDASENLNSDYGNCYDTWHPGLDSFAPYRPVSSGLDGGPGVQGFNDDNPSGMGGGNVPPHVTLPPTANAGSVDDDDEFGWPGTDDEVETRLKSIQITVRFVDPQNSLVRQVTFIESLVD